jgi:hypothetical protein
LVERGPEKAGVGGSIPSLATNPFNNLATAKKRVNIFRAYNTRSLIPRIFPFGVARSNNFQISRAVLLVLVMCCRARIALALRHSDIEWPRLFATDASAHY